MKNLLLKITASLAFWSVGFSLLFGCDVNRYGNISTLRMLYYFLISLTAFGIGILCTKFAENSAFSGSKKRLKGFIRIASRIIGCLTFFEGFFALLIGGDGATVMALGFSCVLSWFIGERYVFKGFTDMFPLSAFGFYIVFTLGCYIFVRMAAEEGIRDQASGVLTAAFVTEFVCAALLLNQSGIFEKANMRKETRASLPKGLTAYNAALVSGLAAAVLCLTVFRRNIAWVLEQLVIIILRGIVAFASLFSAEKWAVEKGEGQADFEGFIESQPAYVLESVGVIAFIVLVIIFRKQIIAAVKDLFMRLGRLLGSRPEETDKPDFTDYFENYSSRRKKSKPPLSVYALNAMYKTQTDPAQKFRTGYRIILYRIKSRNHTLSPSDTTAQQAAKGSFLGTPEIERIAGYYDNIRYNGSVPDKEQLDELDEMINEQ